MSDPVVPPPEPEAGQWKQYPDATARETYPPLPSKGKPTNVPMPDDVAATWVGHAEQATKRRELTGE